MIISKTPLRISFSGGGTDLRSYYKNMNYGAVLSTSIDSYIYVSVKKQTALFQEKYRLNYSETELVDVLEKIKNPIIRECIRYLEIDDHLYISTIADVPASTGLGSSSAFCVGLLNALYKFKGESVAAGRLAEEAAYIECDILQRPMGKQDHYAAAFGGLNYIRFYDDETVTVRPLYMAANCLKQFSDSILMFWTGLTRPSESILKEQNEKNIDNAKMLMIMRENAFELSRLLMKDKFPIQQVGEIIHDGWNLKKSLASGISNSMIDHCYSTALELGALGGKISGAGGGGFLMLVAIPKNHAKLVNALKEEGLEKYSFGLDSQGTSVTEIH